MRRREVYVAYEGEQPVCVGTAGEIAEFWNVTRNTVWWYLSPKARGREDLTRHVERTGVCE